MSAVQNKTLHPPMAAPADIELVRGSDLFDATWYVEHYPDVSIVGIDPVEHYLWLGGRLNRNPSPKFDGRAYLKLNNDVAAAGINPLLHYLRYGHAEGRWLVPATKLFGDIEQEIPRQPRTVVNWVMNPDNVGWAYGNNARALAEQLHDYDHVIDGMDSNADIALYFDIKIFKMRGVLGKRNVLRVGGPRPLKLTYGEDVETLRADLKAFDAVIVLNNYLMEKLSPLHPNVHLIPNAVDLKYWSPVHERPTGRPEDFVVGFAGNLTTASEKQIKGFVYVEKACEELGLNLLHFGKGEGQIAREDMRSLFYSKIDCLVHPVAAGKEGCSNVIMEALSLGVPVITTMDAGLHAEEITDGDGIIYCQRDSLDVAEKIKRLRDTPGLRESMRLAGRRYAENRHDVTLTASLYQHAFRTLKTQVEPTRVVRFVPFWEPVEKFASSRLRCWQPSKLLEGNQTINVGLGLAASTDVAIVSQLASDETMSALNANPQIATVYDVCDRYYDDERIIGGVHAKKRFFEMAERAAVIVASTVALKREITALGIRRPVVFIPDGIDYLGARNPEPTAPDGPIVWYGNPGRNNFESSRWMVDRVLASSRPMRLISRRRYFSHVAQSENSLEYTAYLDITTDWKFETFVNDLRQCSICLLSHAPEENTKSQNRLITAVANGVPVIVTTAPSCEGLLRACGLEYAIVSNEDQLDHALLRLSDVEERRNYLNKLQNVVNARFGDEEIASRYEVLVKQHIALPGTKPMNRRMRVLFVSHNLSAGEGAPTSLLQTVLGLKSDHAIDPVVFSVRPGALEEKYRQAGIEVIVPDFGAGSRITSKIIGRSHKELAECLREVITRYGIEAMVVNTATCLGFVLIAESMNIPSLAMIRESSSEHVNFTFGPSIVMDACRKGLDLVKRTVFVSEYTRQLWQQHHTLKCPSVIPNGISVANFDNVKALDKATARRLIKQPDDGVLLLSVGSINARKSQLDIIEALAALPEEAQRKLRLVLVGAKPSEYLDSVKARLAELPILRDRVHIEEETAEIGAWYRAADVFVFASRNESYPRVIVEAMSFGLPLVSSTVFGTQEQIVENESGLLFVPGDVAALSGHLLHILSDEHLRTEMSKSSAERFWELTSYHEMVNQYATLIYDLAHDSRSEDAAQAKSVMVAEPAITQS